MKRISFVIVILLFTTKAYSQRHFTLVDTTHRDTLIYMNDISGYHVPVNVKNLILDRYRILKVETGTDISIRSKFLRTGIGKIINPQKASLGDKSAEKQFMDSSQVLSDKSLVKFNKKLADRRRQIETNSFTVDTPSTIYTSKDLTNAGVSPDLSEKNNFVQLENIKISENYREYRYCYTTKDRKEIFFKEIRPDFSKAPVGILLENLKVEYKNLDTLSIYIYDDSPIPLQTSLLRIGVVGFKDNNRDFSSERKVNKIAYQYAQENRLGVWHNYYPDDSETWMPDPLEESPIRFKNPYKPPYHPDWVDYIKKTLNDFNNLSGPTKGLFAIIGLFGLSTIGKAVIMVCKFLRTKFSGITSEV